MPGKSYRGLCAMPDSWYTKIQYLCFQLYQGQFFSYNLNSHNIGYWIPAVWDGIFLSMKWLFFLGNMVVYWSTMLLVNYLDAVYENCIEKMACHTLTECLLGSFIQSPMPGYYGIYFPSLPHHSQNSSMSLSKWHNFEAFIGEVIIFKDYPISRKALSVCKPWLLSFQKLSVYQQTEGRGCLEH